MLMDILSVVAVCWCFFMFGKSYERERWLKVLNRKPRKSDEPTTKS